MEWLHFHELPEMDMKKVSTVHDWSTGKYIDLNTTDKGWNECIFVGLEITPESISRQNIDSAMFYVSEN